MDLFHQAFRVKDAMEEPKHAETEVVPGFPGESVNEQEGKEGTDDQVLVIARKAILNMSNHRISMTPDNYRTWFEYLVGSNAALREEMDRCLKEGVRFSDQLNEDLCRKYFQGSEDRKILEEIARETRRILSESMEQIGAMGSVTEEYFSSLNGCLDRLGGEKQNPMGLTAILSDLIFGTRRVIQASSGLKENLAKVEKEADSLRKKLSELKQEARRDALTGLYNRKHIERCLRDAWASYQTEGVPFSIIMMDIDHFKGVNDTYGHKVGDAVLEFIGATLTDAIKGRDIPARYGGEEFVVLLPRTTRENACLLAENIRREISSKTLRVSKSQQRIGQITLSAGVAQIHDREGIDSVVERADRALYLAKNTGRNNVKSEKDLAVSES